MFEAWYDWRERKAAQRRWAEANRKVIEDNRCICGQPGTVTITDTSRYAHMYVGGKPVWRRCDAHKDVPLTTAWTVNTKTGVGTPMVKRDGVWQQDLSPASVLT